MKRTKSFFNNSYFFLSSLLMLSGCSVPPILKIPATVPPIIKEYKHITLQQFYLDMVNTGVYLMKGDYLSILVDKYYARRFLKALVGNDTGYMGHYHWKVPESGYLYLFLDERIRSLREHTPIIIGVDIIVWTKEDYDQISSFFQKMREEDPENEEIINALDLIEQYKETSLTQ